jgi:hypothetical protein
MPNKRLGRKILEESHGHHLTRIAFFAWSYMRKNDRDISNEERRHSIDAARDLAKRLDRD